MVRCVSSILYSYIRREYRLFPVLPILPYEPHSDAKIIQFPDLHLHYDYRFWSDKLIEEVSYSIHRTPDDWPSRVQLQEDVIDEPFVKKMVCLKEMPFMGSYYNFMPDLEEAYQNHVLVDNICPHQGYQTFPSS